MSIYSIKDLEILSGIKAHTLRIWEQRYQIIEPKRTDTNIRFYDDTDLRKILNIALLNQNGFKISKIANMPENEIGQQVNKIANENLKYPHQVSALVLCMVSYDERAFDKIMSKNMLQFGFENTMIHIIMPFLTKVGMLWLTGAIDPSQEHFISHLIRQKMMVAIDGQIETHHENAKKFLLFLPEGEYHDIPILFASYVIRSRNSQVLYLGQSLPLEHVIGAHQTYKPDYILINLVIAPLEFSISDYIKDLSEKFSDTTILLAGYQFRNFDITLPSHIRVLNDFSELGSFL